MLLKDSLYAAFFLFSGMISVRLAQNFLLILGSSNRRLPLKNK